MMAGYIKIQTEKFELQPINTTINTEIFEEFQKKLKQQNIPMNVVITVFVEQYVNGRYKLNEKDILKWEGNNDETKLSTSINKSSYIQFKEKVKSDGHYIKHVLSAFIEDYANNDLVMEFIRG